MARLAVAVAGAAIGSAIPGVGPNVGWVVGSIVGQLLFPTTGPDTTNEGPRLGDLTVTGSTYGAFIPIGYGTIRTAGNIIWAPGIEEVKTSTETSTGGKGGTGGSSNTSVTYTYFADFAIGFAEGIADDVLRIWADGKLIFDKRGTSDDISKAGLKFRFYGGTETQEPDGLIEADKGVNATPAFRGMCYIVFEGLALADFANRIPNITAEITFAGIDTQPVEDVTFLSPSIFPGFVQNQMFPDYDRGRIYMNASSFSSNLGVRVIDTRSMTEIRQASLPLQDANGNDVGLFADLLAVLPNGFLLWDTDNASSDEPLSTMSPDSLEFIDTFGPEAGTGSPVFNNGGFARLANGMVASSQALGPDGLETFVICASETTFARLGILKVDDAGNISFVWSTDDSPNIPTPLPSSVTGLLGVCGGVTGDGFTHFYAMYGNPYDSASGDDVNIMKITVLAGATFDVTADSFTGSGAEVIATLSPGDIISGESTLAKVAGMAFDQVDGNIIFRASNGAEDDGFIVKVDSVTGAVLYSTLIPVGDGILKLPAGMNHSRLNNGTYGELDVLKSWAIDTISGEVIATPTADWASREILTGSGWWDAQAGQFLGRADIPSGVTKWLLFRGSGGGAPLDTIVADQNFRVGYVSADIVVTDLVPITVPGFMIGRLSSARANIQALAPLYFFDGIESDYKLNFVLRDGKAVSAAIVQDDLAGSGSAGEFFTENRTQEVELPGRFAITYMDKDNDYQQQTHAAKRILNPDPAMLSRNEMGFTVSAALEADFVKQSAEAALYGAWNERSSYQTLLSWKFLALDPADVITVTMDDGTIFRERLISTDVGVNFAIETHGVSEEPAQYTSTVDSSSGDGPLLQEFLSVAVTKLILLCSPLLRDRDDNGRVTSTSYFAMGGFGQPGWRNGTLFRSADNIQFDQIGSTVDEMVWGAAGNALGDVADYNQTDEVNTLTVYINTDPALLVSVTQTQMLNGANAAALIHANGIDVEIIQFRDVVTNPDGSRTLSGLLRGRRGTDTFTDGHSAGDTFLLLTDPVVDTIRLTLGEVGVSRFYKGVTNGQLFEEAPTTSKASPANDLKPYTVAQQDGADGGSDAIDITWVRQTRVGGQLQDGSDGAPLNEDSEEYELEIFDGPGGSLVRTVTALSTPAYTYTSADQTTDGFSPPLVTLEIKVYQISAQVGRGFSEEVTIDTNI